MKFLKCPKCHRETIVDDNIVMVICPCCFVKMIISEDPYKIKVGEENGK